jgi:hypothetical protein
MSSSSVDEIGKDDVTQEIHEQQLVVEFDYPRRQDGLQIGPLILRLLGFSVVILVDINPNEVQIEDVAVEIVHNGFYISVQVWVKIRNGARGWESTLELQKQYHYTSYLA